ncbi:MAG: carboxypeptidase regulatory-like domain-containing protein [Acidobacteriota bacterium]
MNNLARCLTRIFLRGNVAILALATAVGMAMYCSSAWAQSGAGSIQGTVTDATGAVIPEARIHVVNQATSVTTDTTSNGVGFYQVPGLFTGNYTVTYTAPNMKTYVRNIQLLVAQNAVINPVMTAGQITQQIEVTADVVQLTTSDNGTISSTLENSRINQLPMNGRNILQLVGETTPGLESCNQDSFGACANGLMGSATEYVADGVTLTNREFGGSHSGQIQFPDPDSIQEVRVETTGLSAQYSTPAAGVITTKSGTNSVHGTMFETARNSYWGIAKTRQNPANYTSPPYIRNEFGASAGGPIVIPHLYHGKDKSFWFVAFERYSLASIGFETAHVPTVAMRTGDFSQLTNSSGVLQKLYDPATTQSSANNWARTAFNGNIIPAGRISPTSKIIFDITPLPTTDANPMVTTNLDAVNPNETRAPSITFRLDHVFNENNRAYLRYTGSPQTQTVLRNQPSNQPASIAADGFPFAASGETYYQLAMFNTSLGYTHVFSPSFFSETVVSQQWWGEQNQAGGTPLVNFEQKLGLPNNFGEPGFPYFQSIFCPFNGTQWIYGLTQIISTIDENLTKTIGKNQMEFGGRFRHERIGSRPDMSTDSIGFGSYATALLNPSTIATNAYSATANTGNANADMFLGGASSYSVNLQPPYQHMHDMEFDLYFQDNYHITRNLTLNLGLRYEAHPAPWMKYGMMMSFDLKNDAIVLATTPQNLIAEGFTTQAIIDNLKNDGAKIETSQQAGMPAGVLVNNYDFTFGPRVGIAWQPFGGKYGTVVRGAYGRYIYPTPMRSTYVGINKNVPFKAGYSRSYTSASQSPDGLPNYLMRAPQTATGPVTEGTPIMGINSANVVDSTTVNSILPGMSINSLNPKYPPNYVTQTNLTVEQPLKGNSALRISWLYTHGQNLDQAFEYNYHPSSYVWEMKTGITAPNGGVSTIGTNQYSSTATGPYDNVTWGSGSYMEQKSGWSNNNALQVNYQRLFHHGVAYQISYVWSKPFRVGGNWNRDNLIYPSADFANSGISVMTPSYGTVYTPDLGPAQPSGTAPYAYYRAMNRFLNYTVDTATPKHHVEFNGIIDLPFGRGKRFFGNANRFLNELLGGFQIAGDGHVVSEDFTVTNTNWGPTNPLHVYKHGARVTDCRSGVCYRNFEWFNGYVAPTAIAGNACAGSSTKVVTGLPSGWAPYQSPIDTTCTATSTDKYYGQNPVNITLANGKTGEIGFAPGPAGTNPYSHTVLNGPFNWTADASLFKVFPIKETVNLRFNMDVFNAFNVQGYNNPSGTDGVETMLSSHNTPRQVQFTLRLSF